MIEPEDRVAENIKDGWVALYRSILKPDSSIRRLTPTQRAIFYDYLVLARYENPYRGCLCRLDGKPFSVRQRAEITGCHRHTIEETDKRLIDMDMISRRSNDLLHISRYDSYQPQEGKKGVVQSETTGVVQKCTRVVQKCTRPETESGTIGDNFSPEVVQSGPPSGTIVTLFPENEVVQSETTEETAWHPVSEPTVAFEDDEYLEKPLPTPIGENIFSDVVSRLMVQSETTPDEVSPAASGTIEASKTYVVRKRLEENDNNNVVRTEFSPQSTPPLSENSDDFTALLLYLIELELPTATAKQLTENCTDPVKALQFAKHISSRRSQYRKPLTVLVNAIQTIGTDEEWWFEEEQNETELVAGGHAYERHDMSAIMKAQGYTVPDWWDSDEVQAETLPQPTEAEHEEEVRRREAMAERVTEWHQKRKANEPPPEPQGEPSPALLAAVDATRRQMKADHSNSPHSTVKYLATRHGWPESLQAAVVHELTK